MPGSIPDQRQSSSGATNCNWYCNATTGRAHAWLRIDRVAVGVEAPDRTAVERRLANLTVVTKSPSVDPLFELFDQRTGSAMVGIGIYRLAVAFFMLRAAPWAARIDPPPGTLAVTADELQSRLLQVNDLGLPWRLEELRPAVFHAEWTYVDARWLLASGAGRKQATQRLSLHVDESRRRVSVIESPRSFSYDAGFMGFMASFSFWRGITFFAYESGMAVGLGSRDGK